jgi:hypothetical protein
VEQLTELIHAAGHTDFRDARGPLGLTQRQAGGRFTRDEADALIEQLEGDANAVAEAAAGLRSVVAEPAPAAATPQRTARRVAALRDVPSEQLAAELQHRGWIVMEP